MSTDRKKLRLVQLLDKLASEGWQPGLVAGWDDSQVDRLYREICDTPLRAKSLPLAAVCLETLAANLPEEGDGPACGIRGLMYMVVSAGWLPDTTPKSYSRIQTLMVNLRKLGIVPYEWIADDCRTTIKPHSWSGAASYIEICQSSYRLDFWNQMPFYCEVIVEKQTLANVLEPITSEYDIPLQPLRGFSSATFAFNIGRLWRDIEKPITVLFISDFDPSGIDIERDIQVKLLEHSGRVIGKDLEWKRIAVRPEHFAEFDITPLQIKEDDTRRDKFVKRFGEDCCEAEAIPPNDLRRMVRKEIEALIPQKKWKALQEIERLEKESIGGFFTRLKRDPDDDDDDDDYEVIDLDIDYDDEDATQNAPDSDVE